MKNFVPLILLCSLCLSFNACMTEKRVHLSGYHVNWKKGRFDKEQTSKSSPKPQKSVSESQLNSGNAKLKEGALAEPLRSDQIQIEVLSFNNQEVQGDSLAVIETSKSIVQPQQIANESKEEEEAETPKKRKKLLGIALLSFMAGVLGFFWFGFILGAAGITLGLISIYQIVTKDKYKGLGFAIAGILLSIVEMALLALYLFG